MEDLRPELIWVQGRCYRKLPLKFKSVETRKVYEEDDDGANIVSVPNQENNHIKQCTNEEPCDAFDDDENVQIEQTSRGLQVKLNIPQLYLRFVIGKGGETKRRLEAETKTSIYVPGLHEIGPIVLNGKNKESVLLCRRKILSVVDSARQRQQPTHFLSIPFNSPDIHKTYDDFITKVLKECRHSRGVDQSIFIEPAKLHLTIAMMVLANDFEREEAKNLLPECYQKIIQPFLKSEPNPVYELNGLEYMNDDPSEVDVLYATIRWANNENPSKLQVLVNQVAQFFASRNLIVKNRDSVKMHVTLMNTRYRRKGENDSRAARETFDARKIIEKFKTYNFGVQKITSLHISQRHATSPDGYYFSTGHVDF